MNTTLVGHIRRRDLRSPHNQACREITYDWGETYPRTNEPAKSGGQQNNRKVLNKIDGIGHDLKS